MSGEPHGEATVPGEEAVAATAPHGRVNAAVIRLLVAFEHLLLYAVSLILLGIGATVLVVVVTSIVTSRASWMERLIGGLEALLLILIILEIFLTVLNHLRGGRIQLEFFVIIGIIALVRHILSIVVRLAIPETAADSERQLLELSVDAGAIFLLVSALAVARWSARRSDIA
jgi:uncharacterized membrane protein (DUF373 family)